MAISSWQRVTQRISARHAPKKVAPPSITLTGAPAEVPTGLQNIFQQIAAGAKAGISLGYAKPTVTPNIPDTLLEYLARGAGQVIGTLPYFIPAAGAFGLAAKGLGLAGAGARALQFGGAMATLGAVEKGTLAERAQRAATGAVTGAAFGPALGIRGALPRVAATAGIGAAAPAIMGAAPEEIAASGILGGGLGLFAGERAPVAPRAARPGIIPRVEPARVARPFPEVPVVRRPAPEVPPRITRALGEAETIRAELAVRRVEPRIEPKVPVVSKRPPEFQTRTELIKNELIKKVKDKYTKYQDETGKWKSARNEAKAIEKANEVIVKVWETDRKTIAKIDTKIAKTKPDANFKTLTKRYNELKDKITKWEEDYAKRIPSEVQITPRVVEGRPEAVSLRAEAPVEAREAPRIEAKVPEAEAFPAYKRGKLTVEQLQAIGRDPATAPFEQTNFDLNAHPRVPVTGTDYISPSGKKFTIISENVPRGESAEFLKNFRDTIVKESADIKQLGRKLPESSMKLYTPRSWAQQILYEVRSQQRRIESPQLDVIMKRVSKSDPKVWDAVQESAWNSPEETFGRIGGAYGYEVGMLLRDQYQARTSMQGELLRTFTPEPKDLNIIFKTKQSEAIANEIIFRELAPKKSYYNPVGEQIELLRGAKTTPEIEATAARMAENVRNTTAKLDEISRGGQVVVESAEGDMLYVTRKDYGFPLRYDVKFITKNRAALELELIAKWQREGKTFRTTTYEKAASEVYEDFLTNYKDPERFLATGAFTKGGRLPRSRKNIEFQRNATILPGFERNVLKITTDSIMQVPERTSQIEFFGGNNEIIRSISGEVPSRVWQLTQRLFDTITGKAARLTSSEQAFLGGWHTYNALTRLHHSFLLQPSAFFAAWAGGRMTFGDLLTGLGTLTKVGAREAEKIYSGTGILQAAARGEDFPAALTSGPRPGANVFQQVFHWLQAPGLRVTDFWARKATAVAGKRVITRAADRILRGEFEDSTTKAVIELARLRPEEISRHGGMTTMQMNRALFNYVNNSNIVSEVPFVPPLATSGLLGRVAYTLKTFAIGFAKYGGHYIIRPAARGDIMPLFKFLMLAGIYGIPVQLLRDLIKNRPTESGLRLFFDGLSNVGGLGIASDVVRSTIDGFDLGPSIAGPIVSDMTDMGRSAAEIGKGNLLGTARRLIRRVPIIGPGLQRGIVPSQYQARLPEEPGTFSLFPR